MNGVRSIFKRKGYLFTALAAAVLLAASSGTAYAQLTITAPRTVNEGESATVTVTLKGFIPVGIAQDTVGDPVEANPAFDVTVGAWDIAPSATATSPTTIGEATGEGVDISTGLNAPGALTFNISENDTLRRVSFSETKTFVVQTLQDLDAEDEDFTWDFGQTVGVAGLESSNGNPLDDAASKPTTLTIDDNETQTYVLAVDPATHKPTEGTGVPVSLKAMPEHTEGNGGGSATLTLNIDKPQPAYMLTGSRLMDNEVLIDGSAANGMEALTVLQVEPDGDRTSDTVTLTMYSGRAGAAKLEDSLAITIADLHALPAVTAMVVGEDGTALDPQPESVTEGESVMIKVMVLDDDGKVGGTAREALKVELSPSGSADARDYRLSIQTLDIASGAGESIAVTLMAEPDEDVGMETLVLNATVSGEAANGTDTSTSDGVLSLNIGDATDKIIEPKTTDADYDGIKAAIAAGAGDDGLNPGDTVTLMTSDLFDVMPGYSASYGASSNSEAVGVSTSGDTVTITADMAGDAEVTVTGTATMGSSSLEPSQTVSNVASVKFPVTVVDTELVVTVSAEPMEIDEGGTSMITAKANRYVTAGDDDVEIDLTLVGDAATLEDDSITIAMGAMSGSTMLTAKEDDDYDNETVTVIASGSGIAGNMQVAIAIDDDEEAPPPTVDPVPENTIVPRSQEEAYPVITGAIETGAGGDDLNPGESFSVPASDLFTVTEGYTASYSASVDNAGVASATVSGDSVTVMADAAGAAKVTITGTSKMASSSFLPDQVATNVADITFEVMVVDKAVTVTVTASAGEVDEGGSVTLTATASRAVPADTVLTVTVTGDTAAVSVADTITISSGATEGTAMVNAVEDDDTANANVTLVVTGDGLASPVSLSIAVTDNDRTVNALTQAEVNAVFVVAVATAAGGDMWMPGGNSATVDMSTLFMIEAGATVEYEASSSDEAMVASSASGSTLTLTAAAPGSATITVMATDSSGDADDMATASSMVSVGVLTLVVTLEMPANVMMGNIVEGESYDIVAKANRMVTAAEGSVEVMIMRDRAASDAGDSDFTVSSATIMAGYDSATATLMVTEDNDPDSGTNDNMGESLVLYGMAGDMATNSLTFTIWDQAVPSLPLLGQLLLALFLMLGGARLYRRRQG